MSGAGPQSNPNYVDFMHGDIFQGFGFMVDPEAGYKSVTDFIDEGMEPTASIKATAEQFRGKALATSERGRHSRFHHHRAGKRRHEHG